jgi:hypothetical protein
VDSSVNSGSTLAEHAQRLRERTDAICRFSGGVPTLEEGIEVFRNYCKEVGIWSSGPAGPLTQPDAFGDEHEVWFLDEEVVKVTYPDFFGIRVINRHDEDNRCLPCEYFERWVLHNELFGDDVSIVGAFETLEGIRTILLQKAIKGSPTSEPRIKQFFVGNGWTEFRSGDECAWFDESRNLVVSDTHPGNLIETPDGALVPIDFRIQPVAGAILDAVRQMIR